MTARHVRPVVAKPAPRKTGPCTHWIGGEARTCGSQIGVRLFIQGPRCPIHDPRNVKGDETA
ncbi:hypothetical protein [Micromonospora inyonensis]|uniref:Uncharacterized protein n=1 Tax=Micromonospora inyonensis TaxID=47866 RepID=A0A1C6R725_9ACTN|nr:hypothetical protein [Micromonospora inyonensis]SCL12815.1 hypothetical protein GA0074694_0011 [Micromonospora inyonensis]SCL21612.1 hypothetical protein GA0074694_3088 [Micromonospora inyonensis]